jgi:hypothetical protein
MTTTPAPPRPPRTRAVLLVVLPVAVVLVVAAAAVGAIRLLGGSPVDVRERVPAAPRLRLDVPNAALSLVAARGDTVTVAVTGRTTGPRPVVAVRTVGERTLVSGGCRTPWFVVCELAVRVGLPADTDVVLRGSNSDVTVAGLRGAMDLGTSNGGVEVRGATGPVAARTTNGAVVLTGSRSGTVVVATTNGGVDLGFAAPPRHVEARSTNAGITVRVPDDGAMYEVDATTTNGTVDGDVERDVGAARSISVHSTNADVSVEHTR